MLSTALVALALGTASCPADSAYSRAVASAELVVIGVPQVAAPPFPANSYVDVPIAVDRILRGVKADGPIGLKVYTGGGPYQPSMKSLSAQNGQRSLFLLVIDTEAEDYYFAGGTPDALRAAKGGTELELIAEVDRQAEVVRGWKSDPTVPHYAEVKRLVERLGATNNEQAAFDALVALGKPAVPAIVAFMDDTRLLRQKHIRLANNFPDAFEAVRQYAPQVVSDGLAAVLNQIDPAGPSVFIYNGGTERQRTAAADGWRVYAHDLNCPPSSPGR